MQQTALDAELFARDLQEQLSHATDRERTLQQKLTQAEAELKGLRLDRNDFGYVMELEQEKSRKREAELSKQLEEAYAQMRGLEASGSSSISAFIKDDSDEKEGTALREAQRRVADLEAALLK